MLYSFPSSRQSDQADQSQPGPQPAGVPAHRDGQPGAAGCAVPQGEPPCGAALRNW